MSIPQSRNRLHIAYLTELDPFDRGNWSGGLYYVRRALQEYCGDVTCIGPLSSHEPSLLSRIWAKSSRTLFKKRYLQWINLAEARHCGLQATQKLAEQAFDVIVAVGEAAIVYLETDIPIVLVGDATFAQLLDYHPYYTELSSRSIHEIKVIERKTFKKVRAVIMSSEWAARSAIQDYQVQPEHVYVVPFGANFDTVPGREVADTRKPSGTCTLLFIAVEWERKGGDIAYEALLKLEEMGIKAELIVCGCMPPAGMTHPHMMVIPFLDKNDERQAREIEKLYATSDFLILPTQADCAPNVFREASAFGLPVITSNTGGIATIIRNEENGYMLPLSARGEDYADLIADIYQDKLHYLRLVQSSRTAFEERLNWNVWGRHVHDILVKECERSGLITMTM